MAMIAITTSSSISVNPRRGRAGVTIEVSSCGLVAGSGDVPPDYSRPRGDLRPGQVFFPIFSLGTPVGPGENEGHPAATRLPRTSPRGRLRSENPPGAGDFAPRTR